jgi:hypothetical protein
MRRIIILIAIMVLCVSASANYGRRYCNQSWVNCIKIKSGQSWESLWPDPYQRDVIKRLNRMNTKLGPGMTIAVPRDSDLRSNDISPFASQISPMERDTIIVSPTVLAWAAYRANGELVRWGPISAGKDYCRDVHRYCQSKTGVFNIYEKHGPECISFKFPVGEGGAPMPYCMFYSGGFALHGSPLVPGYNASHGCIRLFIEDARWLNQEFIGSNQTKVIVLPYGALPKQRNNL